MKTLKEIETHNDKETAAMGFMVSNYRGRSYYVPLLIRAVKQLGERMQAHESLISHLELTFNDEMLSALYGNAKQMGWKEPPSADLDVLELLEDQDNA
jgi:hypothetical protein